MSGNPHGWAGETIPLSARYDAYHRGGPEASADHPFRPSRVGYSLPAEIREQIVTLAPERPELSPREFAVRFTDEWRDFVSEATVYVCLRLRT